MGTQRFEIKAQNGQVLEYGIKYRQTAIIIRDDYRRRYPNDNFSINEYEAGKYGKDYK